MKLKKRRVRARDEVCSECKENYAIPNRPLCTVCQQCLTEFGVEHPDIDLDQVTYTDGSFDEPEVEILETESNQPEDGDMDDDDDDDVEPKDPGPPNPYRRYLLLCRRGYGGLTDTEAAEVDAYDAKMGTQGDWRSALHLTKISIDDLLQRTPPTATREKRKARIRRVDGLIVPRRYTD